MSGRQALTERGEITAHRQRRLQQRQDREDAAASSSGPIQADAREQPLAFAAQHLAKPGREADLAPEPRYHAPGYAGSAKLRDMAALITGGDSGNGRAVAVLYAREGADVAIVCLDQVQERADAEQIRAGVEAEGRRCLLLPGDVRNAAFCQQAVRETVGAFGRLDVLVNNAAFQLHADAIDDLDEARLDETLC